jgi:SRSO17 transposase
MGRRATGPCDERLDSYIDGLASVIGHADRVRPLHDYLVGLMLPAERKSVEPMAAVTTPTRQRMPAHHQSLLHFVGKGLWSDEKVLAKVREMVLPGIERHGAIRAWIIDDTGFPKQGCHSVGVWHQYCGQLGKQANCQVAVSLSLANDYASLPVAYRLYLPQSWIEDEARRTKTGVPEEIAFKTKPQIALEQIRWACEAGLPRGVVLMDAGYGVDATLRMAVSDLDLTYVAGVLPNTLAWKPGKRPQRGEGAPKKGRRGDSDIVSLKEIALALPARAWRTITWREGTCDPLSSRFARLRVHVAHRHLTTDRHAEEWLLVEWPEGEAGPTKYWLSTARKNIAFDQLVDLAKLRWRIERDYQELKQEVGLGHYEGRGWRGFHHHATLCIAAYGFLISERETIPPSGPCRTLLGPPPALPEGWRPRGSPAPIRASRADLDCHAATTHRRRHRQAPAAMPQLPCIDRTHECA